MAKVVNLNDDPKINSTTVVKQDVFENPTIKMAPTVLPNLPKQNPIISRDDDIPDFSPTPISEKMMNQEKKIIENPKPIMQKKKIYSSGMPSVMSLVEEMDRASGDYQDLDTPNLDPENYEEDGITNLNDDEDKEVVNLFDVPGIEKKGNVVHLSIVEMFGEELFDMDNAINLSQMIKHYLLREKKIIVNFKEVKRIHSYFFILAFAKFIVKFKKNTTKYIKVTGLDKKHLKILNLVAANSIKLGEKVLSGIQDVPVEEE